MNICKGSILISTPNTSGDIFSRSVVLIIEHNHEGSFGLILNKNNPKTNSKPSNILDFNPNIYNGGPVGKDRIFFIIKGEAPDFYHKIKEDYSITEDIDSVITDVFSKETPPQNLKIFSGYSGWAPNQLENEIKQKLWVVLNDYALDYTLPADQNLWKHLLQKLGKKYLLWINAPHNILYN